MTRIQMLLMLCFNLFSTAVHAGWTSNGGEVARDQGNIWFIGDQPVEYCVAVDPEVGVSLAEAQIMVRYALRQWQQFFTYYGIDKAQFGLPGTFGGIFPDQQLRRMSLDFKEVATCSDISQQISFHFGTVPDDSVLHSITPTELGAAIRSSYNHATYRSGGYVWIRKSFLYTRYQSTPGDIKWSEFKPGLQHVLLHELGHVFGMQHGSTSVMMETMGDALNESYHFRNTLNWQTPGTIESLHGKLRQVVGETIEFCQNQGGVFGVPVGWCSNSALPQDIRQGYGLEDGGYHKLKLFVLSYTDMEITISPFEKPEITIPLKNASQSTHRREEFGPALYTRWLSSAADDSGSYYKVVLSGFERDLANFNGYATVLGQTRAAIGDSGLKIQIFNADRKRWWFVGEREETHPFPVMP